MNHATHSHPIARTRGMSGWGAFAGYLMIVAGVFQMIAGFVALFKSDFYIATANQLVLFDYSQWGWVHILIGIILAFSAISLLAGRLWGRILGVTLATLSAIANFGFIWAYPLWSIMIIAIDIAIIYSIVVSGGSVEEE